MSLLALAGYNPIEASLSSYSPYMGGSDIIVQLSANQIVALDNHILATYLPLIFKRAIRSTRGGTFNLMPFLHHCPAVRERLVSPRSLRHTFALLLDSLARNVGSSETPNVDLMSILDMEFQRDGQALHRSYNFRSAQAFPRTFSRFVALSSIASSFHSKRIRSVLTQFFVKSGSFIARAEGPHSLFYWAYAILQSDLLEADIISCLREVLLGRPEFLGELRRMATGEMGGPMGEGAWAARMVFENLREICERMDGTEMGLLGLERGRGLLRREGFPRRYSFSPLVSSSGYRRLGYGPTMKRGRYGYGRGMMRSLGYPARNAVGPLVRRQENQEYRLSRLENKVDAVEEVIGGGYLSDGFVGAGYLTDGIVYDDLWSDGMVPEMDYDPAFLD